MSSPSRSLLASMPRMLGLIQRGGPYGCVRQFATEELRQAMHNSQYGAMRGGVVTGVEPPAPLWRRYLTGFLQIFLPSAGIFTLGYGFMYPDPWEATKLPPQLQYMASQQTENEELLTNWSETHVVKPKRWFYAESELEVEQFLRAANGAEQKLRVVGSALSPNGLGLCSEGILSMGLMDRILGVDKEKMQVTVQSGCRVQQVADALKPYGLTLQNYASIREQQIGGFTQVGAHGTGAKIPPVDEQVVSMNLATPGMGVVRLSNEDEPDLFKLAKVGLGGLGVVTEITLQCVPRHELVEKTFTANVADVKKNHVKWLQENQHLRYMWIPYTDSVVVVQCNPKGSTAAAAAEASVEKALPEAERLKPLRDLLVSKVGHSEADVDAMSATQLRDALLAVAPLDQAWVTSVNKAEAEFWKRSSGTRVGYSDEILGFDCGGQQWVLETAFQVSPNLSSLKHGQRTKDLDYMDTLMSEIKKGQIPAPSPIEQRWTSGSSAAMSPVAGPPESVHSWVGVIMYLPEDPDARKSITDAFRGYTAMVQNKLMPKYGATWHWAKLEVPSSELELSTIRSRLSARYPLGQYNAYRKLLDPKNILANEWLDKLIPRK